MKFFLFLSLFLALISGYLIGFLVTANDYTTLLGNLEKLNKKTVDKMFQQNLSQIAICNKSLIDQAQIYQKALVERRNYYEFIIKGYQANMERFESLEYELLKCKESGQLN